ncbi:MAG TPA: UDP-N-acetylmuramoyl-L-alanine--D-glutamate ligase [Candidatus Acidoferrales bacterium]|nr:UDP-N-acetylmuramoyl-L-alanine--D-glutamate ligase [Candidatus Acidoferrales bacterium]
MKPGFELRGKRILVVGLARTGVAAALFCSSRGARVTATDRKAEHELAETVVMLRAAGVALALGGHELANVCEQDFVVVSPGVPVNAPVLEEARKIGIPVWSEIELAWRFLRGKLIAITGSNGKTTTTSLVAHILKTAGIPTLVGGNIGVPLLSLVESSTDATVTVAEISSFQLENIDEFRPEIGVLLNLTPDHLDRHASFDEYAGAKMRMFENQNERDAAILNADDSEVTRRMPNAPRVYWFSRKKRVAAGAFLLGEEIVFRADGDETQLLRRSDITLRGEHNVENVLAASSAAFLVGAPIAGISAGVKTFPGVEHRLEFVGDVAGVQFYNDSKATNVDAAVKAIEAFPKSQTSSELGRLIVILGGKDKGSPYTPLRDPLAARARDVLLIGAATEKIAADLEGAAPLERAGTLDRAVQIAKNRAKVGDIVLLAPACASFDQFENYEQRGRIFKELVAKLSAQAAAMPASKG